jgi:hypothetical protein
MAGQVELNRAEIQHCRTKILLPQIFKPALLFHFTGNGRPVVGGNIKLFNGSRNLLLPAKVEVCMHTQTVKTTTVRAFFHTRTVCASSVFPVLPAIALV